MALRDDEITELTTLRVLLRVTKSDGTAKSLAGATFNAKLGRAGNSEVGVVTVLDAPTGLVETVFPAATGMAGFVIGEVHMTLGGETQCVWHERLQVTAS